MKKPTKNSKQSRYSKPKSGRAAPDSIPTMRSVLKGERTGQIRSTNDRRSTSPRQVVSYLDELKGDVAAYFELNAPDSFSRAEVLDHFDVVDPRMEQLVNQLVDELTTEGRISETADGQFAVSPKKLAGLIGTVDHVNARFAFVSLTEGAGGRENDIYVSTDDLNGALDGDTVRVMPFSDRLSRGRSSRIEGTVTGIVDRAQRELVGKIEVRSNFAFVRPDSRKLYEDVYVPLDKIGAATTDEKVIVKISAFTNESRNDRIEGEVVTVLGRAGDNNTEMHAILAEFGLPNEFSDAVEAEAEAIPTAITEKDMAGRRDMRNVLTFTIDPFDAKDFDDALSVKWLDNGHYEIGIHIADVTHYVRPGSALEAEAFRRATSVYLVDRVVPMLPEKLSNGLCSLRPHEDKLTFSAVFELDANAQIVHEWFGRTAIHSDRRFAYEEAQAVLNADAGDYLEALKLLNGLAYKLRDRRFADGAINFESVEVKFKLADDGTPLAVIPKIRQDTNKLIEEFMLLANKRVAEKVVSLSTGEVNTMVYRIHEGPNEDKLQQFADFARRFGYSIQVDDKHLSSSLNTLMTTLEGKPEQNMLQQLAVRTMSKARYSTDDLGHFGLAFRRYSHFTSPIRRYPDMMAHRLLQYYLDGGKPADRDPLEVQCRHASEREKAATDAERASIKYKQVEFMATMPPDQSFAGIISGVTEFGIFIEITENSCEGLVRMQDLADDFYELDKENYRIIGSRGGKIYTFGDSVTVRVKETNLARRSMDFALVSSKPGKVSSTLPTRPLLADRPRRTAVAPKVKRK